MVRILSDDDIDAMVLSERPESPRATVAWRATQRNRLVAHINGSSDAPNDDSRELEWTGADASRSPQRRWQWAAAGVVVIAGVAALAIVPGRSNDAPGPVNEPSTTTSPAQVANMAAPGITVSPEVVRLLSLPACESADGLAEWTAEQLSWWRSLDPSIAQPAEFSSVTAEVAVDTGAMSAACSAAISMDGALTWGLGDGSGNWVARATGVPDAVEYEWPTVERVRDGDDGTGGPFGTGQYFNDFNVRATDLEAVASGALSPARSDSASPIYVIEFAPEVGLDSDPSRLWYLRTTTPTLDENVSGPPDPALVPSLVPEGFGRCTVEYVRTNTQGIGALAVDYCNRTSTITVTADKISDGEPISFGGIDMVIRRDTNGVVAVGFDTDAPVVIGPATVPDNELAAMLASMPAINDDTGDAAPVVAESTTMVAVPPPTVAAIGVAIGDQVMLGVADELVDAGYIVDAMVSRTPTDQLETVETLIANPNAAVAAAQAVVIHVGNNGPIDPVSLDATMAVLQNTERVTVITSNVDGDEFDFINANNELIRALPERFANVHVVDWAQLADDCPGDCFEDDNLLLRDAGRRYYAAPSPPRS